MMPVQHSGGGGSPPMKIRRVTLTAASGNYTVPADSAGLIAVTAVGRGGDTIGYTTANALLTAQGGAGGGAYEFGYKTVTAGQVIPFTVALASGQFTDFNSGGWRCGAGANVVTSANPGFGGISSGTEAQLKFNGTPGQRAGNNITILGNTIFAFGADGGVAPAIGNTAYGSPPGTGTPASAVPGVNGNFPGGGASGCSGGVLAATTTTGIGANGVIYIDEYYFG